MDQPAQLRIEALDTACYVTVYDAPSSPEPHPLLLVTNGDDLRAPMVEAVQELAAARRIIPPVHGGFGYGGGYRVSPATMFFPWPNAPVWNGSTGRE